MKKTATMKPILISTPMVQAILDGRKTQTRRILKTPHDFDVFWKMEHNMAIFNQEDTPLNVIVKPKYLPGDVLYVRETFAKVGRIGWSIDQFEYNYRADYPNGKWSGSADMCFEKWTPSLFMPKEAARIFLKVTAVKAERLQDINEADAIAEGVESFRPVPGDGPPFTTYKDYLDGKFKTTIAKTSFQSLWMKINGRISWSENPWVWAYTFERCNRPQSEIVNPQSAIQ